MEEQTGLSTFSGDLSPAQVDKLGRLNRVAAEIRKNLRCPLKDAATNLVFGKGNPDADIIFIGEAPGKKEDEQGIPFVGAAGKQLDRLLHSIGLSLQEVYIANILKYRPPDNRDPQPDEIQRHTPYLVRQISIIQPKVLATLGNFSTKFILAGCEVGAMNTIQGISALHGKLEAVTIDDMQCTVIPLYHPAAMLYRPQLREILEQDFQTIRRIIDA
jgi:DNA polymerase